MNSFDTLAGALGERSDMTQADEALRGRYLLSALKGTDITVFYQGRDLKYQWIENPPVGWNLPDIIGFDDHHILPKDAAEITTKTKLGVIESGRNRSLELEVKLDDASRWFDIWIDPDFNEKGAVQGILCFAVEITDRKRKEENLRALLMEVSHRSRNLLAIVQSIAKQSMQSGNNEHAIDRFNERIQSLAISLEVVTTEDWDGATLNDLIAKQTVPYMDEDKKLTLNGLNPRLTPNAALHIGLAVQELISNSALKNRPTVNPENVRISASPSVENDPHGSFVLEWREKLPQKLMAHGIDEMDILTLQKVVPAALSGSALVSNDNGELVYLLTVPAENFS